MMKGGGTADERMLTAIKKIRGKFTHYKNQSSPSSPNIRPHSSRWKMEDYRTYE
jgi:hypothetical protein